ncbi:hypothetical protein CEXT_192531 [Caerostris extrusa]|uniref:Uncharacterized protein n=1 Tax=Caerostris extrusa TaxID=172846 RepID=A0AAV4X7Z2_CAEEX|nr:hypothetical protein CEXT_192531 [Caerostris extrusa]
MPIVVRHDTNVLRALMSTNQTTTANATERHRTESRTQESSEHRDEQCHHNYEMTTYKIVIRADKTPSGEHAGRFNAPTVEVAIIMVGDPVDNRDIKITLVTALFM